VTDLADAMDLALDVGQLVQQSGGHAQRTVDLMERMALALGVTRCHCAISSVNVSITVADGEGSYLSGGRGAGHFGINFNALTQLRRLVEETERNGLNSAQVRARLTLLRNTTPVYRTGWVLLALGLSTAAFAGLFHASQEGIALAFLGGWAGAWTRHWLVSAHYKPFASVTAAAFISGFIVALGTNLMHLGGGANAALAACALFLVPGVPMLNGTADLLTANYLNGLVKLAMSAVIVASAAVGLTVAVALAGVLT
jgi:uncharacterized membrane protein YjjP (DUF1212 family)